MATKEPKTPAVKELTAEQLQAKMQAMQEAKQTAFQEAYSALSREYNMQLVPIMELIPGTLPNVKMIVQPVPPQA